MAIKQRSRATGKAVVPKSEIKTQKVRVRAVRIGYYDHKRRREGDVFVMTLEVDKHGDVTLPTWVVEATRAVKHGMPATATPNGDDLGI